MIVGIMFMIVTCDNDSNKIDDDDNHESIQIMIYS